MTRRSNAQQPGPVSEEQLDRILTAAQAELRRNVDSRLDLDAGLAAVFAATDAEDAGGRPYVSSSPASSWPVRRQRGGWLIRSGVCAAARSDEDHETCPGVCAGGVRCGCLSCNHPATSTGTSTAVVAKAGGASS